MSDDERDIDVESEDGDDSDSRQPTPSRQSSSGQYYSQVNRENGRSQSSWEKTTRGQQAEKRAHHNALERKRRDHIKDSFSSLRDSVPSLNGEKVASRAQILKKAADYIQFMRKKNHSHQQDIDDLKRQNNLLEAQSKLFENTSTLRTLEKAKTTGSFGIDSPDGKDSNYNETESDTSDMEGSIQPRRPKKQKIATYH